MAAWVAPVVAGVGSVLGGALAGMGGKGGDTEYAQSPEQRAIYNMAMPNIHKIFNGEATYDIPNAPAPTQEWYDSISPEVKQGMMAPYQTMSNQLTESLGYSAGSARGGASGVLGNSQARFWGEAGQDYGQNLWNMTSPGLNQNWQAQLNQNMMPYTGALGAIQSTYSQPIVSAPQTSFAQGMGSNLSNISNMYLANSLFNSGGGGYGGGGYGGGQMYNPAYMNNMGY